jgi:hypothetical protein
MRLRLAVHDPANRHPLARQLPTEAAINLAPDREGLLARLA